MTKLKRLLVSLFALAMYVLPHSVNAQIIVQAKTYPTTSFNMNDLWNQMISNYGASANVVFEGTIKDGPVEVSRITTQSATLNSGATLLTPGDVFIVDKWIKPDYPYYNLLSLTNTLPFGDFEICFKVKDAQTMVELASECTVIEISPSSPPLLVSPTNYEEIYTNLPAFSWFPPAPILPDYNLVYDIKIAEILNGQTAEDAIQYNNPIVFKQGIASTYYQYEMSNIPLQYNTFYAWQIIAKNNVAVSDGTGYFTDVISLSDVYVFVLRQLPTANPDDCFHVPAEQINSTAVTANKKLKILFYNEDNLTGNLNYEITDNSNTPLTVSQTFTLERGSNRYIIDLESISGIQNNAEYTLTIYGSGSKTYLLKFKYTN